MAEYATSGAYYVQYDPSCGKLTIGGHVDYPNVATNCDPCSDSFSPGEHIYYVGDPFGPGYYEIFEGYTDVGILTSYNGMYFLETDADLAEGTMLPVTVGDFAVCFCAGTLIVTPEGMRAVETLAAGDRVLTASGETRQILWVGRQRVVARFADPLRSYPIRIAAGALAENVPSRALYVSPDHALLVDGLLVQAGALVNGTSITRVERPEAAFTYYHLEVEDHALILAEGAVAETFVDNVTRRRFDNYAEYEALFGECRAGIAELDLPRIKSTRQLPAALQAGLAARAEALGVVLAEAA